MTATTLNRSFALLAILIGLMMAPAAARAQQDSMSKFIQSMGDTALTQLTGENISLSEREKRVRQIFNKNFDVPTIAKFALGSHWRAATEKERKEYLDLFEDMIVKTYAERFEEYSGQQFKVGKSKKLNDRDTIVTSQVIQKDGPPVSVEWRVRNTNGQLKIIDVIIENVSMSITQRSDFDAVIQRGGGKVETLLASLRHHQVNP